MVVIAPLLFIVTVPFTVGEVDILKIPLIVKSLKVDAEPLILPFPEKITVPEPALKVPLFVNDPPFAIEIELLPAFNVEFVPIVTSSTETGKSKSIMTSDGITTTVDVELGTAPHQLLISFQSPVAPPIHVPFGLIVTETLVLVVLSQLVTVCEA